MSELQKTEQAEVINAEKIGQYLTAFGLLQKLTPEEKTQCIEIAKEFQLNPFKREIHFVKYGNQAVSIVIGYDVFIKRAERAGKLDGWRAWIEGGNGAELVAKIEIFRKDWNRPFLHEVYLQEAKGAGPMWTKAPRMMLKKVVTGQGFRLCFPDELGGLPYLPEELDAQIDPKPAESQETKKATDEPVDDQVKAAGAIVKTWIARDKELNPDIAEKRRDVSSSFMALVTAKDTEGAVKYANNLPKHPEPVDVATVSEIFDGAIVEPIPAEEKAPVPDPESLPLF